MHSSRRRGNYAEYLHLQRIRPCAVYRPELYKYAAFPYPDTRRIRIYGSDTGNGNLLDGDPDFFGDKGGSSVFLRKNRIRRRIDGRGNAYNAVSAGAFHVADTADISFHFDRIYGNLLQITFVGGI